MNQLSAWITRRNSRFAKCSAKAHAARRSWLSITTLTGCYSFAITSLFSTTAGLSNKGRRKNCSPTTVCFISFIWPQWDRKPRKLQPILRGSSKISLQVRALKSYLYKRKAIMSNFRQNETRDFAWCSDRVENNKNEKNNKNRRK